MSLSWIVCLEGFGFGEPQQDFCFCSWLAWKRPLPRRKSGPTLKKSEGAQKVRLVANPLVSVSQLEDVLHSFMKHRQTGDLLSLVCPPPAGPQNFGWHTPPSGPWLSKAIGLLYDLVGLASNTKLQSIKVMKAMQNLHRGNVLTVSGKPEDVLDKCDLCVRVLMSMLRTAKTNENLRSSSGTQKAAGKDTRSKVISIFTCSSLVKSRKHLDA